MCANAGRYCQRRQIGGTWRENHYPGLAVAIPVLW